ncbi:MAG: phosphatase PAP2 family protein [Candidatus Methanoperedens sp.]|nr:phosphatase PAP2 family protein [Candidatus Methanoperedens sp.]
MMLGPVQFLFSENIIIYLQSLGNPSIDKLFIAITTAGSLPAYFALSSLIFWCFNKKTGIRSMYFILLLAFADIFAKNLFDMSRPPEYLHKIQVDGTGFPSGHALISAGFWVYLGTRVNNRYLIPAGAAMVFLVSLSRVYLGVHYAGDVAGGILFGCLISLVYIKTEPGIFKRMQSLGSRSKYFAAIIIPCILIATATMQHALLKEQIEIGAIMASIGIGYLVEEEHIRFEDARTNKQKIKRAITGVSLLSITYLISSLILASQYLVINYIVLGLTATVIVPLAFTKVESTVK